MSGTSRTIKPPFRGQPGVCHWCGGPLPKGRRSWCSDACVETYRLRSWPRYIRQAVWERDRGVCAICGVDADKAYSEWVDARREIHQLATWLTSPLRQQCWCERRRTWVMLPRTTDPAECRKEQKERDQYLRHLLAKWGPEQQWTKSRKSGWDADHTIPVAEGGADLGLDNYRTLCHPCHKAETRKLMRRLRGGKL